MLPASSSISRLDGLFFFNLSTSNEGLISTPSKAKKEQRHQARGGATMGHKGATAPLTFYKHAYVHKQKLEVEKSQRGVTEKYEK